MSSPQRVITDTNKAPLIQVLTLMFLVIIILSCLVRTGTKLHIFKVLKADDYLDIVSAVVATAQSAITFHACEKGLGKVISSLTPGDIKVFYKSQYAANVLFIASLVCSKLSGTVGLRMIARSTQLWTIRGLEIAVAVWGISSLLVSLFQCKLPAPWDYSDTSKCVDRQALWNYFSVTNILTDIAIIAIMIDNVRRLNTTMSKKALLIAVFGCRILIIPAAAAQIYFTNKAFASNDTTFSLWETAITVQLVQCLAIFTVCAPNLKPFLDSLESGQIRIDDLRRQGKSSSGGYPTYRGPSAGASGQGSGYAKRSKANDTVDILATGASRRSEVHEMATFPRSNGQVTATVTAEDKTSWDGHSQKSQSSQTILIHQTWQVDVRDGSRDVEQRRVD